MTTATNPQARINRFTGLARTGKVARKDAERSRLRLAVDPGTTNIVLAAVDGGNRPVTGGWRRADVMRDSIVADWLEAITNVREILTELHDELGHIFTKATITIPPRISEGTVKVLTNVLDACELDLCGVVNKPVVTARVLDVTGGTIVDIGHGTTGMSRLRDGVVDFSTDEPTDGHHMTLMLSGALEVGYDETEAFKYDPANVETVFPVVRPTLEKIATIAGRVLSGADPGKVYPVGGSSSLPQVPNLIEEVLGATIDRPEEPLFPIPLGTAMRSSR